MGFKTRMDPLTRLLCRCLMVCFHCPTPMSIHILIPILIICRKAPLGLIPMVIPMQSYHENYLKNHHIGTDICVKLGTVPICIRIGIRIGSVGTVLHIVTARKWSLRRLCFYTCLPVILFTGGVRGCGGHAWLQGACVVAGGGCVVVGGHAWLRGAYIVAGGMRGCRGACMVAGGMRGIRRNTVNQGAVRILLECILVILAIWIGIGIGIGVGQWKQTITR